MDRRGNWATDEVEEMIESIKEREILCLPEGKKVRSLDVFKVVANDLRAKGMYRTPEQIRTKMRILRKDYFKALRSGSKSEYRACEFFTSLHDLFTDAHRKMEAKKRRLQRRQQQQQQQLRVLTDNPSNGNYQPASHRDEYPGDLQEHRTKKRTSTATSSATIKSSRSSSVISSRMLHEEAISVDQSASFAVPTVANDSGGGPGGTPDGSVNGKQRPEPLPDKYHLKLNEYLPNLNSSLANLCKTERYADVTLLVCNDEESLSIPAHRLLLGTFSSYFANIFERTTQLAPQGMMYIVLPPLVTRAAIQSLLQYMYSGETIVSADLLDDVMLCGQLLRVHGFCTRKSTTLQTQKPQPSLTSIPLVSVTKNLTLNHTIETLEEMEHVAPVFEAPRIMATYHQPRYQQQTPVHDHRPAPDRQTLLAAPVAPVTLVAPVVPAAPVAPAIPVAPVVPVAPAPERSASALAREREQAEKELELERLREREREREREQERKRELERELEMEKEKQREKEKREKEEKEREREKEEREREEEERKKKEKEREREEEERERVEKEREREEKEREREEKKREREEKERERAEKERERVEKEREREEKERQRQWEKDRERQRLRELELDRARERERDRQRQMDRERLRALGLERVRVNDMDELARFAPTRILAEPDVEMLDANGREDEDDDEDEEIRNVKTENAAATEEDDDAEDSRDSRSPTPQPIVLRPKNKPKLPLTDSMRTIDGLTSDESALEIVTNGPESSPFSSRAQNSPKSIRSSPRLESIIESDNEDLSLPNSSELPGLAAARPDDDHLDEPHSVSAPDDHLVYSPLGCQLCSDTFTTPGDWVQHVYGHCGEDQSQWKRRRMSRHDDKGTLCDSRYRCDMCSSFFSTRNDWLGHVVVDHEECINDCLIALPFNDYDMKKHSFPSL